MAKKVKVEKQVLAGDGWKLVVKTANGSGSISLTGTGRRRKSDKPFDVAVKTLESTLLALACVGYGLDNPSAKDAIQTVLDGIANEHGD